MRVRVHREPVAMRRKCPVVLRKYGWCGVLAVLYATNLPMPQTELAFNKCLATFKKIISGRLPRWDCSNAAGKRGGITTTQTVTVLAHFHKCCGYSLDRLKERGVCTNVNNWLKRVAKKNPRTMYIVHTGKHCVFVDVPRCASKWVLYDQGGPKTHSQLPLLNAKGKVGRQRVYAVFTITPPATTDSPRGP